MEDLTTARTEELTPGRLAEIRALLDEAFDGDFTDDDWSHAVGGIHVLPVEGPVVVHAAVVARRLVIGDRALKVGYVEGVATIPNRQREGQGSRAMQMVQLVLRAEFELGALSTSRHEFYGRLGWERWRGPTFVRDGNEVRRTEDEDDGIMVLRCVATRDLDLSLPITCESRQGDDW